MAVRTYDPSKVIINIGGFPISGFADGSFIVAQRENDSFTKVAGADGVVSRAKSSDKSGNIALTLAQTSPSNDILSTLLTADELTGAGVIPVILKDMSGRTTMIAANGWIRKPANAEFGKEITNREWMIDIAEFNIFVGGNGSVI